MIYKSYVIKGKNQPLHEMWISPLISGGISISTKDYEDAQTFRCIELEATEVKELIEALNELIK